MADEGLVTARTALRAAVAPTPKTIDDVVTQLTEIERVACRLDPRGEQDGIGCFTRLYKEVTVAVRDGHEHGEFDAGDFILDLDVAFAQRFLDALRADLAHDDAEHSTAPHCWRLLFDARRDDLPDWHFAALGVNAHVNFDLAFALLDVWEQRPPGASVEDQHADYGAINRIFAEKMDDFREEFGAPAGAAEVDGGLGDRIANFLCEAAVVGTRELAWLAACQMWRHRDDPDYRVLPTRLLDAGAASFAGLLV